MTPRKQPSSDLPALGGVVLCGGQSRRMGRDKASLPFGGTTLLECVVSKLTPLATPIVVVAAADQAVPTLPAEIVRDAEPGMGPLVALAAGLDALRGRADVAYVTACDSPFLSTDWILRLASLLGDHDLAVAQCQGKLQMLAAIYRVDFGAIARRNAESGRRDLQSLTSVGQTRIVAEAELIDVDPTFRTLCNLNTPEEYDRWRTRSGR